MTISTKPLIKFSLIVSAGAIAVAGLTGCTTRVVEAAPAPSNTTEAPADTDTTETEPVETETPEPVDTDNDPATDSEDAPSRADFAGAVQKTLTCSAGSSIDITETGTVVELDGDCGDVTVSTDGAVVLAGSVKSLDVMGTGNVVMIESAKSVDVDGTGNVVTWDEGSPVSSDTGIGNILQSAM